MKNIFDLARKKLRKQINYKPLLVISLHKSGTHLIRKIIEDIGFEKINLRELTPDSISKIKSNQYYGSHHVPKYNAIYNKIENNEISVIFHYRDPRDIVVSRFNWHHPSNNIVTNTTREFLKKIYKRFDDDQEFLRFIISGEQHGPIEPNFIDQFKLSRGLLFHPNVLKTNFESLIGSKGGGSDELQIRMIKSILNYLSISDDAEKIAKQAFSNTAKTFHKGKIGAYKTTFSKETLQYFNDLHHDILQQYGYEISNP